MSSKKSSKVSNNSIYEPYGGWPGFMLSHGLKPWNSDDVEEGKQIRDVLKESAEGDLKKGGSSRK